MNKPAVPGDAPTADEVRASLEHIVASQPFRSSPQLSAFLTFVVESVLDGKSDRIKGYTIGIEVLRRDADFDPQLDPIVRVEATRLRRALERYYADEGTNESVIIELPRGSYVPTFRRRIETLEDPEVPPRPPPLFSRRSVQIGGVLAVVFVAIAGVWWMAVDREPANGSVAELRAPAIAGNGMPVLQVEAIQVVTGEPGPNAVQAATLFDRLVDAFSRFDAINIALPSAPDGVADYRIRGSIEYLANGLATVRLSLLDIRDGGVVWSRTYDQKGGERPVAEAAIVKAVANPLLGPFGFVRAHERAKQMRNEHGDPRYRCLLVASDAFRSFAPQQHAQARECLENLVAVHPDFALGYAYLAVVYYREWTYGFGKAADDPAALDTALKLARRGVELRPDDARITQVLSSVLFSRGDISAATASIEKAVTLNPYDIIIATDYGGRLITIGQIDRGMAMLDAISADSVRPSWHHFYVFLADYMRGRFDEATHAADQMTSDTYSYGLFARALMAARNGHREKAVGLWRKLVALRPAWATDPRGALARYITSPEILDRLTAGLAATGLPATN